MIITSDKLALAKLRWYALKRDLAGVVSKRDQRIFVLASTIIDNAICHSDIVYGLALPEFLLRKLPTQPDVYEVLVDGQLLLAFWLTEFPRHAEVSILT